MLLFILILFNIFILMPIMLFIIFIFVPLFFFYHLIMKQSLLINVYQNDVSKAKNKPLFSRIVYYDDSVNVDFQKHLDTFRFLFGSSCIVSFELSSY